MAPSRTTSTATTPRSRPPTSSSTPLRKIQITAAVCWKNPAAAKVVKTLHKTSKPDPIHSRFADDAKILEYEADGDLRDFENVALDPSQTVNALDEAYFKKEVLPHVPDEWIDASKRDPKDNQIDSSATKSPSTATSTNTNRPATSTPSTSTSTPSAPDRRGYCDGPAQGS